MISFGEFLGVVLTYAVIALVFVILWYAAIKMNNAPKQPPKPPSKPTQKDVEFW